MKKYNTLLSFFIIYILINMVIFPSVYIEATLNGISAWAFNVLPSVLPFIFFVKILTTIGSMDKFTKFMEKPCRKLFKTPSSSSLVFLTSIISGYPVGAKMTAELYEHGKIKKSEAFKMCSFCSTSGPMFIIGAVGISMLANSLYGYIIFSSHIIGAFLNGLFYRNLKAKEDDSIEIIKENKVKNKEKSSFDITSIVLDSAISMLIIGTIIAIFFVVITSLSPIFNLFPPKVASILEGMVEITKGCQDISKYFNSKWAITAATFVISFGGISTILQSISMLTRLKMPITLFCLQKFTHACLAALISVAIVLFI